PAWNCIYSCSLLSNVPLRLGRPYRAGSQLNETASIFYLGAHLVFSLSRTRERVGVRVCRDHCCVSAVPSPSTSPQGRGEKRELSPRGIPLLSLPAKAFACLLTIFPPPCLGKA